MVTKSLKQPRPLILHSLAKINALALLFSLHRSSTRVWVLPFFALTQPHSSISFFNPYRKSAPWSVVLTCLEVGYSASFFQMRELPVVIRVMEVPLLSSCWDRSRF
ncbi:uncharacterized protein LOC114174297 [Vigna unguiculata]|uniref:uncharacterized protein LOC114174297 n=1 Tax=Vigna unguiculata TaxID=3917 RepID=UPI0010168FAB|nr:uncharacterized protein LOC114174297 [Vigna unguiculata]